MKTISKSTTYNLKWQIKDAAHLKVSECGRIFNTKTEREIKRTLIGYSVGFWIQRKFYTLKKLRDRLQEIKDIECPF